jgi:hypothetical protein
MGAKYYTETSVDVHRITWRYTPDDKNLQRFICLNILFYFFVPYLYVQMLKLWTENLSWSWSRVSLIKSSEGFAQICTGAIVSFI